MSQVIHFLNKAKISLVLFFVSDSEINERIERFFPLKKYQWQVEERKAL
jgi:hypothetical protein